MDDLVNSSKLPFDIRGEVLARLLAEKYDLELEQVLFCPKKHFQRQGRRDVLEVSEGFSFSLEKKTLIVEVSRESIFDTLPDGIFFHPDDDYPDDVYKSKKISEQEVAARQFLLPFEQLFYWLRLENEYREYTAENQLEQWWQALLVQDEEGYSPLKSALLTAAQKEKLISMLPHLPDIIGNWNLTAQWLSLFLETTVTIQEIPPPTYELPQNLQRRLGESILGQDFVIGATFSDGIPAIQISLLHLTPDIVGEYLPEGHNRRLLEEELLTLLLPVETPYELVLELKVPSNHFQIGIVHTASILGYTTVFEN